MSKIMDESLNFECSTQDCQSRFISEKRLFVHKKKHDMNLLLNKSNQILSDQTPTPTRFIRNCEAIGLFQDLQNVNPFEETFKKATEAVKKGHSLRLPNVSTLGKAAGDDLHTPQVDIVEQTISSRSSCEEMSVDRVVRSEADTSLEHSPGLSSTVQRSSDYGKQKMNLSSNNLQLVFKMPGGTLLQISTLSDSSGGGLTANNTTGGDGANGGNSASSAAPAGSAMNGNNAMFAALIPMQMMASTPPARTEVPEMPGPPSLNVKQKLKALLKNTKSFDDPSKVDKPVAATPKKRPIARMNPSLLSSLQLQVKNDKKVTSSTTLIEEKDSTEDKKRRMLERNRVAAMKCREKRKRWVADLRDNYVRMCSTNDALVKEVNFLRVEVSRLKELLLAHRDCPTFTEQLITLADTTPTSTSFSASTIRLGAAEMGEESQEQLQGVGQASGSLRLDIEEASKNTVLDLDSPLVRRDELLGSGGQRARAAGLRLDIEEASRNTVMDLDSPLVRRDEILTSVAPPTTPNERLISFPELSERVQTENSVTEAEDEATETGERVVTTVIQVNPNLLMKGSTFS